MTPPLPHRGPPIIQAQQVPDIADLSMAPRRLHAMHPRALAVLEEEFAADLLEVAALERFAARRDALEYRLHAVDQHVGLHVGRLAAEVVGPRHA
jgi:hypothetical protein